MPIFRTRVAHPFDELRDELDRVWSALTTAPASRGPSGAAPARSFPAVNVAEREDAVIVEAELPGLEAGEVEISVKNDELILQGSCAGSRTEGDTATGNGDRRATVTWHRRERDRGPFERRLTLPVAIDASRVEAHLVDGVLTVTCPKAAEAQPRKVEVRTP